MTEIYMCLCTIYLFFLILYNDNLTNPKNKEEACDDNKKQKIVNPQLLPLQARRLQDTAIAKAGRGLVWSRRALEKYLYKTVHLK